MDKAGDNPHLSNVGSRAWLLLSWRHQGLNHRLSGSHSCILAPRLQYVLLKETFKPRCTSIEEEKSQLTLNLNTLGHHLKPHNPEVMLLILLHFLLVVVQDEGEVVVKVELRDEERKAPSGSAQTRGLCILRGRES